MLFVQSWLTTVFCASNLNRLTFPPVFSLIDAKTDGKQVSGNAFGYYA